MSKMDGLRAMREARYAENAARAKSPTPTAKKAATKPAATKAVTKPRATASPDSVEAAETAETAETALCGHRNMSGRSCTREHGHAAKSHRYS